MPSFHTVRGYGELLIAFQPMRIAANRATRGAHLDEPGVHGGGDRDALAGLSVVVGAFLAVDDAQHDGLLHRHVLVAHRVEHA